MDDHQMKSKPFLEWLSKWEGSLPSLHLEKVVVDPASVAVISVDLLRGFCEIGPLASERSASVVPHMVDVFQHSHDMGVRHFLLLQDTHEPQAAEFSAYPPHCIRGTEESETVAELQDLDFSDLFTILPKNSISSSIGTGLLPWLEEHAGVNTFIIFGVCTDICVYHAAIDIRARANVRGEKDTRVIVPANCVQTYHMPVETSEEVGGMPHHGDLLHRVFLYQMALNDVEVVARLA